METQKNGQLNCRIIIIDDDPGIRDIYRSILAPPVPGNLWAEGAALFDDPPPAVDFSSPRVYDLVLEDRGENGVRAVQEAVSNGRPFAMAFIDMKMPGIDGAETAKRIWEIDADIKVIFVTAYSERTPDEINRIAGRDDSFYLRKPFNPEEIRQFARALTNEWALEREREYLAANLKAANQELEQVNRNLNDRVQLQTAMLIQSEKMASIGILAAGVAHEINNPISFINGNLATLDKYRERINGLFSLYRQLEIDLNSAAHPRIQTRLKEIDAFKTRQKIDYMMTDMGDLVAESREGAERIRKIVMDLRTFSRVDQSEYKPADLHQIIDSTLNMIANEMKYHAEIVKQYGNIPPIKCFPQKLSQVFMNLLINAVQAINDKGVITIETRFLKEGRRRGDEQVKISISDNGCGIAEENLKKLFDPFFTTKPVGKGTGLGLSISYDIIKAHGGEISVQSQLGVGSTFCVTLPLEKEI